MDTWLIVGCTAVIGGCLVTIQKQLDILIKCLYEIKNAGKER